jgi:alpha-L-fucosidase 2
VVELSRRQVLKAGAAVTGALMWRGRWPRGATAAQSSAGPATGDLRLFYDEPAGSQWLRALPVGNGRLGAMVFGNIGTERLQLNEDTVWAGGPHDYSNAAGAAALPQIQQLVFDDQWSQAENLANQAMLGSPAGQLAYQPVGNLRLAFTEPSGASNYWRELDLETATCSTGYVAGGVARQRRRAPRARMARPQRWTASPATTGGSRAPCDFSRSPGHSSRGAASRARTGS